MADPRALPPGFVLETQQQAPSLPEGFMIEPQSFGEKAIDVAKTAGNWLGTRATNLGTGLIATGRGLADVNKAVVNAVGLPDWAAQPLNALTPGAMIGQFGPTAQELAKPVFDNVITKTNTPGPLGHVVDAGVEALPMAAAGPGGFLRNLAPSFLGGAAQELAGGIPGVKGTNWEPLVRLLTGAGVGVGTAGLQHGAESVYRGISSSPANVDRVTSGLLTRAIENDKTTLPELLTRQGELGTGAPLVEAGGPNVRGLLRGAIAEPGIQRTTAQEMFDARKAGLGDTAASALDRSISPNSSVSSTVEELSALQRHQAGPAYEAAGIPSKPAMISPERTVKFAIDEPSTTIPAEWNTPSVTSPRLEQLMKDSGPIKSAVSSARSLSDYRNLPQDSMVMWDEAYKHLGGMERAAKRAGNDYEARKIGQERINLKEALADVNPRYGRALEAYREPQHLKDAAEQGKEWMKPSVDPSEVVREFQSLPAPQQDAARIGIRDWARSQMERTDRNASGVALWSSPANRAKLQGILEPGEFADLERQMNINKNVAGTATDINVGSRTAPMLAERADIANQVKTSGLVDLLTGHPFVAAGKALGSIGAKIGGARNEAVNAKLAELLTGTDAGALPALVEQARLDLLRRRGALGTGALAPSVGAFGGGTR